MSYPRPYTVKTIDKHLKDAGFSQENAAFLNAFFRASANLYGVVSLRQMYSLYRDYKKLKEAPKLHLRDFVCYAVITRRAVTSYHVYPYDEVRHDGRGEAGDIGSLVIHNDLIMPAGDPFNAVDNLLAHVSESMRYYMDPDFLTHTGSMDESIAAKNLMAFYSSLKSTGDTLFKGESCERENSFKGMRLDEMPVYSLAEEEKIMVLQKDPKKYARALQQLADQKRSAAEILLGETRAFQRLGYINELLVIRVHALLEQYGAEMNAEQDRQLEQLLSVYTDTMPCDRLRGWSNAGLREYAKLTQQ
ncbi:MAG: hypothetical protein LKE64_02195 [Solobacterium sp.]|jgi:hypothetical protein|nr:hypothetical protein [Solobacterium sp.]MCH4049748.1 hypothetical protein [Solobacterium sp.]MCH4073433.1 hypothetical protein [Solobacterium sp.]MCI1313427.1 hypothetical protein [Solobacterium sp.]MCI1345669.1 hypothetical protein [Solobacterium sp.]